MKVFCLIFFFVFSSSHVYGNLLVIGNTGSASCNAGGLAGCGGASQCVVCSAQPFATGVGEIVSMCSGDHHTLAVLRNGSVLGSGLLSVMGLTLSSTCSSAGSYVLVYSPVAGGSPVVDVACFQNSSAFLLSNGTVLAAGSNQGGCFGVAPSVLPFVASPAGLEYLTGSTFVDSMLGGKVKRVGMGQDALLLLSSNGSVWTLGSGVLRGGSSSLSPALALLASPCRVTGFSVGELHALLLCSNRSVAGYGDNSFNQLAMPGRSLVATPEIVAAPLSARNISMASCGRSHSLLLDAGLGKVFGAGDNSTGALGPLFDSSASTFLEISHGLPVLSDLNKVVKIAAGPGVSYFVSSRNTQIGSGYSNVLSMGTTPQCVLGYNASINGATPASLSTPSNVFVSSNPYILAQDVCFSRRNRVLLSTLPLRTFTTTMTASLSPPSSSRSLNVSFSKSASGDGHTRSGSSLHRTFSVSTTFSVTNSLRSPSATVSNSLPIAPFISRAILVHQQPHIRVEFNIPTTRPPGKGATASEKLLSLFRVDGYLQSFGLGALGSWQVDGQIFDIWLGQRGNVTPGVGLLSVAPFSFILSARQEYAAPADPLRAVAVERGPPVDTAGSEGASGNVLVAIIVSASVAFVAGVGVIFFVFARRRGWIGPKFPAQPPKELYRVETQRQKGPGSASVMPPPPTDPYVVSVPSDAARNFASGSFVYLPRARDASASQTRARYSGQPLVGFLTESSVGSPVFEADDYPPAAAQVLPDLAHSPVVGVDEAPLRSRRNNSTSISSYRHEPDGYF
jgi:hypothetical protein